MTNVKSNHDSPLALPGGPTIPANGTVFVERWPIVRGSFIVKAWLAAKVIEVVGEEPITAPDGNANPDDDKPKTAAEVLAMADTVHFQTFKAEAQKVLGEGAPSKKDELIAALEERATAPE
jgi:hypothetical protein